MTFPYQHKNPAQIRALLNGLKCTTFGWKTHQIHDEAYQLYP